MLQPSFLPHLPSESGKRILVWIDLASGLHEGAGAALAHEEHAPVAIADGCCRDPNG